MPMEMKIKQSAAYNLPCYTVKLLELMMTILPSTSTCERGLRKMNSLKTKYRYVLSQDAFNNQLVIMQEGPKIEDFNPSSAINKWLIAGEGGLGILGVRNYLDLEKVAQRYHNLRFTVERLNKGKYNSIKFVISIVISYNC